MRALIAIFFCFFASDIFAFTMGDAINMAGRQRMLSQRITQSYILMGIQPESVRHQQVFERCMTEFANNLKQLDDFAAADPVDADLKKVKAEWETFSGIASRPVDKKNAADLFERSNIILPLANQYVMALQKLAGTTSAELVNISGRQRMLSQRMAKNYLAQYWGVAGVDGLKLLYEDLAEFENMLDFLLASELNTPEINRNLLKTRGHLKFVVRGFDGDMSISGSRLIFVISGTTDILLRNMDVITKQYAALLK